MDFGISRFSRALWGANGSGLSGKLYILLFIKIKLAFFFSELPSNIPILKKELLIPFWLKLLIRVFFSLNKNTHK